MEINATPHKTLLTRPKPLVPTTKKMESFQENGQFPPPQTEHDTPSPSASRPSKTKKLSYVVRKKRVRRVVGEIFPCKICLHPFTNKTSARLHAHAHLDSDELEQSSIYHGKCPHCQKIFFHRQEFTNHVNGHGGRRNHECPVCKNKFTQKTSLIRHAFVHLSGEEQAAVKQGWQHVCYFCNKRFKTPSHLSRHLLTHTMEKLGGRCPLCRKAFSSKRSLTRHRFLHLNEDEKATLVEQRLSRRCLFCQKIFPDNDTYQAHLVSHIPEKPFRCDQCGKLFLRNGDLKRHLRSHSSNPEYFKCDECDQAFTQKPSLAVHKKTVHRKVKDIACPECPKMFGRKGDMVKHLNGVHLKVRHPCSHCDQSFTRKATLGTHLKKVHPSESRPPSPPK